jgi:hypothetical protein
MSNEKNYCLYKSKTNVEKLLLCNIKTFKCTTIVTKKKYISFFYEEKSATYFVKYLKQIIVYQYQTGVLTYANRCSPEKNLAQSHLYGFHNFFFKHNRYNMSSSLFI